MTLGEPRTAPQSGSRIESIDTARILAIFMVMYSHMSMWGTGDSVCNIIYPTLWSGACNPSAIFFIFSGYFATKSDNWGKALLSAAWCLAAYLFWMLTAVAFFTLTEPGFSDKLTIWENWLKWSGFCAAPFWTAEWASAPIIGTFWYVRTLFFLLLLAPLLKRFALPLFSIIFVSSLFFTLVFASYSSECLLPPAAVAMFLLGCLMRQLPMQTQNKLLSIGSPWIVGSFWFISLFVSAASVMGIQIKIDSYYFRPLLLGIASMLCLYQTAVLVTRYFPKIGQWSSKLAPAVFMAYVTHDMVRLACEPYFAHTHVMALIPVVDLAACWMLCHVLKRISPHLLHLVGYTKLP